LIGHALALCLLVNAGPLQDARSAVTIDRVMAVVSSQPIMLSDATAAIEFRLVVVPAGTADPEGYVLDRLIRRRLILAEVERFQPPEPDPIEITVRIDDMEKRAGSAAAFDKALAVTGLTREQLRRQIRDDLRIDTYLNERFPERPDVDRAAAIDSWAGELRKRTEVTVLYQGR
jgi:hypothetical protein